MAKIPTKKTAAKANSKTTKVNKNEKLNDSVSKKAKLDESLDSDADAPFDETEKDNKQDAEIKSSLLSDCKKMFQTTNLYEILNICKKTSTNQDVKKAYYKLSLKYHPDKVTDESLKEDSKLKFQILGKIYSILSDDEKKKIYDETGIIDGEDDMFPQSKRDWDSYFRSLFKKISGEDIQKFYEKYKNTDEERTDVINSYEKHKGNMDLIMQDVFSEDIVENEARFRKIIQDAIDKGDATKYDIFVKESKKNIAKRKAHYEKEAKEAEELRDELGMNTENDEALKKLILANRQKKNATFLDNLTKKYANADKKEKKPANNKNKKSKKDEEEDESEDSIDEGSVSEAEEMVNEEVELSEDEEETNDKRSKRTRTTPTASASKKATTANKKTTATKTKQNGKVKQNLTKKVKRL